MTNYATYCPEDNKLRLYIGRVPREEYLELKGQGWKSTPKQDCDFVATWRPDREDVALKYAGVIEDEDQSPEDRAADRAERFASYRDKRTSEALELAGDYESKTSVHGYQNANKAHREAARHDRIGSRAVEQWSKAEYWTARTAGVIAHALYRINPSVRLGRIKKIETELRDIRRRLEVCGERSVEHYKRWEAHLMLRIAYENQMIEASGGSAQSIDYKVGGTACGYIIWAINKSNASGKVTSLKVLGPAYGDDAYSWHKKLNIPGTEYAFHLINIERSQDVNYTEPTEETLNTIKSVKAAKKKATPKAISLINPTIEEAARLQQIWNDDKNNNDSYPGARDLSSGVLQCTQKQYSERSKGSYAQFDTVYIDENGMLTQGQYRVSGAVKEGAVCKVRRYRSGTGEATYCASSVIVVTDKPQKKLPIVTKEAVNV